MKFSDIAKGIAAEKKVAFKFNGKDLALLVRPISALEERQALIFATKVARDAGAAAERRQAIFDGAVKQATLAVACLDPESPAECRQPFFGAAGEVLELDPDTLASLYAIQEAWQEETSPSYVKLNATALLEMAQELSEDPDPLACLRRSPLTLATLLRFMGVLLLELHAFKPSSSSSSNPEPTNSPEKQPRPNETESAPSKSDSSTKTPDAAP